jgi:hypothetical protein
MPNKTHRLRRVVASTYLLDEWGLSRTPKTLAKQAVTGGGPVMEYDGRIPLYTPDSLDEYASRALSEPVKNTSELRAMKAAKPGHPLNPINGGN